MKIAVWHNLPSGGGRRALQEQTRGLLDAGHEVVVWTPQEVQASLGVAGLIERRVALRAAPRRPRPRSMAVRDLVTRMDQHLQQCAEEIRAEGADLVLVHPCRLLRAVWLPDHLPGLPSVLYLHEPLRRLYEAMPELPWLQDVPRVRGPVGLVRWVLAVDRILADRARGRIERRAVLSHDRVLANSYFSREVLERVYGVSADVCYLSVDTSTFTPFPGSVRGHDVVAVGTFQESKGTRLCIEALATIPPPRPRLQWFSNAARPEHERAMTQLARRVGVELQVHTGEADDVVLAALRGAMATVFAPRLEPFGLAPLEAAACGTPVVTVRSGGPREVFEHDVTALVVDSTPSALGAALVRVRDEAGLAQRLGEHGFQMVHERFGRQQATQRLLELLREVLGDESPEQMLE